MNTAAYSPKFLISSNFLGDCRPSTTLSYIASITSSYLPSLSNFPLLHGFRLARNCGKIKLEATAENWRNGMNKLSIPDTTLSLPPFALVQTQMGSHLARNTRAPEPRRTKVQPLPTSPYPHTNARFKPMIILVTPMMQSLSG